MTDDLEAGWERERKVAEAREARERALADCGDVLEYLRERGAAGPVSQWVPPAPEPVRRQPEPTVPRPKPLPAPPVADEYSRPQHDAAGRIVGLERFKGTAAQAARSWQDYIEDRIARRIEAFAVSFGEGIGDVLREDIIGPYTAKIAALEARIAELERAAGPGVKHAAD